jgi:hypothetical protein
MYPRSKVIAAFCKYQTTLFHLLCFLPKGNEYFFTYETIPCEVIGQFGKGKKL